MTPETKGQNESNEQTTQEPTLAQEFQQTLDNLEEAKKTFGLNANLYSVSNELGDYLPVIHSENPETIERIKQLIKEANRAISKAIRDLATEEAAAAEALAVGTSEKPQIVQAEAEKDSRPDSHTFLRQLMADLGFGNAVDYNNGPGR